MTACTSFAVVPHECADLWPGVFLANHFQCLVLTEVTSEYMVVLVSQDAESEVFSVGDPDASITV